MQKSQTPGEFYGRTGSYGVESDSILASAPAERRHTVGDAVAHATDDDGAAVRTGVVEHLDCAPPIGSSSRLVNRSLLLRWPDRRENTKDYRQETHRARGGHRSVVIDPGVHNRWSGGGSKHEAVARPGVEYAVGAGVCS
jgi:hypothetical protein